jgi:hypothetical protein
MSWHGPGFVIALIAISTIGIILNTWIRARHGYPLNDDRKNPITKEDPSATRRLELLTTENGRLTGQVGRLEERIAVLERIATDPAERTAREIDSLR